MSAKDPEDINGDGTKDVWIDTDGDGIPDKIDFDGNGFADGALLDVNNDGVPDAISVYGMTNTFYLEVTSTPGTRTTTSCPSGSCNDGFSSFSTTVTTPPNIIDASSSSRTPESSTSLPPGPAITSGPSNTPETTISTSSNTSSLPVGAIAGGTVGGAVAIAAILGFTWLIMRERRLRAMGAMSKAGIGGIESGVEGIEAQPAVKDR